MTDHTPRPPVTGGALDTVILLVLSSSLGQAHGQDASSSSDPAERGKTLRIARTETAPAIDGVLDEPVWAQAPVIDDLHQYDPVDHGEPSERTEVYVLYDDDNLYVAARMFDSRH